MADWLRKVPVGFMPSFLDCSMHKRDWNEIFSDMASPSSVRNCQESLEMGDGWNLNMRGDFRLHRFINAMESSLNDRLEGSNRNLRHYMWRLTCVRSFKLIGTDNAMYDYYQSVGVVSHEDTNWDQDRSVLARVLRHRQWFNRFKRWLYE